MNHLTAISKWVNGRSPRHEMTVDNDAEQCDKGE